MPRQKLSLRGCFEGTLCELRVSRVCSSETLTPSAAGPVITHPLKCIRRDGVDVKGLVAAVVREVARARVAVVGP